MATNHNHGETHRFHIGTGVTQPINHLSQASAAQIRFQKVAQTLAALKQCNQPMCQVSVIVPLIMILPGVW